MTVARASQVAVETLLTVDSAARASQVVAEVAYTVNSTALVSQLAVEVLLSIAPPVEEGRRRRMMVISG